MAKKKKVVSSSDNTCTHCAKVFFLPIGWCEHCSDHHHKDDMRGSKRGWCSRCEAGGNEEYLAKRAAKLTAIAAVLPASADKSDVEKAYILWVNSPEYKNRFSTDEPKKIGPAIGADAEREAIDNEAWINKHFAGL